MRSFTVGCGVIPKDPHTMYMHALVILMFAFLYTLKYLSDSHKYC